MEERLLVLADGDFDLARKLVSVLPDFLALERVAFPVRMDLLMRFAIGTARRPVFATALITRAPEEHDPVRAAHLHCAPPLPKHVRH